MHPDKRQEINRGIKRETWHNGRDRETKEETEGETSIDKVNERQMNKGRDEKRDRGSKRRAWRYQLLLPANPPTPSFKTLLQKLNFVSNRNFPYPNLYVHLYIYIIYI